MLFNCSSHTIRGKLVPGSLGVFTIVTYLSSKVTFNKISTFPNFPGKKSNVLNVIERTGMSSEKCKPYFPTYITEHHFCTYGNDKKHICIVSVGEVAASLPF